MSDFLDTMAELSAARAAQLAPPSLADARPVVPLRLGQFDVIAEIKDHSPSVGVLADGRRSRREQAAHYAAGGAAAISVLTEPSRFKGELAHLREVVAAAPTTPVMCKDFLVDPQQILAARAAGASGVLLIATMLDDAVLMDMLDCAFDQGMFVLLETFDKSELERCAALLERPAYQQLAVEQQLLIGVNTRNLRTLAVDPDRLQTLAGALPAARCVAESGLQTAADAAAAAELGYHLALVGSALMQSDDPADLVRAMCAAGSERIAA